MKVGSHFHVFLKRPKNDQLKEKHKGIRELPCRKLTWLAGKSPFWIGDTSSDGCFSSVMLVFREGAFTQFAKESPFYHEVFFAALREEGNSFWISTSISSKVVGIPITCICLFDVWKKWTKTYSPKMVVGFMVMIFIHPMGPIVHP